MIVTSGGTKIHPEIPEKEIEACPDVARAVVFADPDTAALVTVVLPKNPADKNAKARIQQFIDEMNENRASFAVRRIIFTDVVFSRENGLLRPNLKLDRNRIAQHFQIATANTATAVARTA